MKRQRDEEMETGSDKAFGGNYGKTRRRFFSSLFVLNFQFLALHLGNLVIYLFEADFFQRSIKFNANGERTTITATT